MMARRLVLLPPFLLLVSAMAAESADVAADDANRKGQPQPRGLSQTESTRTVLTKFLPFLHMQNLEAEWNKHKIVWKKQNAVWKKEYSAWKNAKSSTKKPKKPDPFLYTLDEPVEISGLPLLQKVLIKVYGNEKDRIDKFHQEDNIWGNIIGAVQADTGTTRAIKLGGFSDEDINSRHRIELSTDVMSDIKDVVEKQYILPGFAVTSFSSAVTAAAADDATVAGATAAAYGATTTTVQRTKFCIVQPFFESWPNLTDVAEIDEAERDDAFADLVWWLSDIGSKLRVIARKWFVVRPADAVALTLKQRLIMMGFPLPPLFVQTATPKNNKNNDDDDDDEDSDDDEVHEEEEGDR
eukprot:GHVS01061486.1.p1 GENE.GHVS01061486.1~~GHVS01061486.1.p1  ORF type:complete len:353 (-),score=72.34 GHVS01061486.1:115-1173(-)